MLCVNSTLQINKSSKDNEDGAMVFYFTSSGASPALDAR